MRRFLTICLTLLPLPCCGGCMLFGGASPSAVNIQLRKEKQGLQNQIGELQTQVQSQQQVIDGLRRSWPSQPSLPPERLNQLFTTHGLELGRLTGGLDSDPKTPGDEGVRVYVTPVDETKQPIKMAGAFTVEAFDLANTSEPYLGKWTFDVEATRKLWRGTFLDYNYVLECLWQDRLPQHPTLTLKVTFVDELTQVSFEKQVVAQVQVPTGPLSRPASQPTTRTATEATKPAAETTR